MGGEQASSVLATVKRDQYEKEGKSWSADEESEFKRPILEDYEAKSSSIYSSARLWDDGIIDPSDTRAVLGLSLAIVQGQERKDSGFGIFRM
jgi:3-methylcrotonyl-CoA carboxylase beta subunit